ncbi:cation:proton antiporter [Salsipaludibacter albus]|uniref:cation:proton antiporter domain-containing protein n=1 Tax=Salsipaludibacter albus TaxID=2849650 RepID=UPI001EE3D21F|nr:cation:proton antiporter [Salsipaludibacter albus]MBY5161377.1 cation:proton antiporter [Salsipaludibacter albus]
MFATWLLAVAGLSLVVAFAARRLDEIPVSAPLAAVVLGAVLGPEGLTLLVAPDHAVLLESTRILLAMTLMTVALRHPLDVMRRRSGGVALLVLVVMPVMMLVAAGVAAVLLPLGAGLCLLLGACLVPTDPVLASGVVEGHRAEDDVPDRLRQLLGLESAVNDGLALVLVVVTAAVAGVVSWDVVLTRGIVGVLGALVVGAALGWVAARALRALVRHEYGDDSTVPLLTLVFSLFVLGLAQLLGLDGILAIFAAGVVYSAGIGEGERVAQHRVEEGVDRLLALPVFALFGVMLPVDAWVDRPVVAVLALGVLVLRRLPVVYLLRRRLGIDRVGATWLGWFGPMGVASIFYLLEAEEFGGPEDLWVHGSAVVAASVLVHGTTTGVGRRLLRERTGDRDVRDSTTTGARGS